MSSPGKMCREGHPSRRTPGYMGLRRSAVVSLLGVTLLLASMPASQGAIVFVKNIGTSSSATTGTTISVTVPAAGTVTEIVVPVVALELVPMFLTKTIAPWAPPIEASTDVKPRRDATADREARSHTMPQREGIPSRHVFPRQLMIVFPFPITGP